MLIWQDYVFDIKWKNVVISKVDPEDDNNRLGPHFGAKQIVYEIGPDFQAKKIDCESKTRTTSGTHFGAKIIDCESGTQTTSGKFSREKSREKSRARASRKGEIDLEEEDRADEWIRHHLTGIFVSLSKLQLVSYLRDHFERKVINDLALELMEQSGIPGNKTKRQLGIFREHGTCYKAVVTIVEKEYDNDMNFLAGVIVERLDIKDRMLRCAAREREDDSEDNDPDDNDPEDGDSEVIDDLVDIEIEEEVA